MLKSKIDWSKVQKYYNLGYSYRDITKKFGYCSDTIAKAVKRGDLITRNKSNAGKIVHKIKPERFVMTQKTKNKISHSRKLYLKNNPSQVPYLLNHCSKGDSYPEKYFATAFSNTRIVKKHRILNYELDFANLNEKLDIEIDGEQHYKDSRIVKHDIKRNRRLNELGWNIVRIRWSIFQKLNITKRKEVIQNIIKSVYYENICLTWSLASDSNRDFRH